nr:PREDICTED: synaptic vesicle glycoprotein 2C-like isoform X2 [Bemisia tabaci]
MLVQHEKGIAKPDTGKDGVDDFGSLEYDTAIELAGVGRFHHLITFICGCTLMSCGFDVNLGGYIAPTASAVFDMNSEKIGLIHAVFLAGTISSCFFWGALADTFGRKRILVPGMFLDGVLLLLSSLSHNFSTFIVLRFLSGFIIGGPMSLIYTYLGEFYSERKRAKVICFVALAMTLSTLILPVVAMTVLPIKMSYKIDKWEFNSWRLLVACMAVPSLLSAVLLSLMPESPRFLFTKSLHEECLHVISKMFEMNTGKDRASFPVKSFNSKQKVELIGPGQKKLLSSIVYKIEIMWTQVSKLVKPPVLNTTVLCTTVIFTNMVGYCGLGIWIPEFFDRYEEAGKLAPNATLTVCGARSVPRPPDDEDSADSKIFSQKTLLFNIIIGGLSILGNLASGFLANRVDRRVMPVTLMLASGGAVLYLILVDSTMKLLATACLFYVMIGTAHAVYNSIMVDLFPPSIVGMGVCLALLSGRFGAMMSNIILGNLLDQHCQSTLIVTGSVVLVGAFVSLFIPKNLPHHNC